METYKYNTKSLCFFCIKKSERCDKIRKLLNKDLERKSYVAFCPQFKEEHEQARKSF